MGVLKMKEAKVLFSNYVLLENEKVMKLDYSLIESISETDKSPYYGVRVTKYLDGQIETDEVAGLSASREKVVGILKKLCEYEVTPISLVEILDCIQTMEDMDILDELIMQGV